MDSKNSLLAACGVAALSLSAITAAALTMRSKNLESHPKKRIAMLGDVGGTNCRLMLKELCMETRSSTVIKELTKIPSQSTATFEECVRIFLEDVPKDHYPSVAVIGIAGAVQNNCSSLVNVPQWQTVDGEALC